MAGGRPLAFGTVEELETAINSYFEDEASEAWVNMGEAGMQFMPTVSGLAYHLDVDRKTITNYEKKCEFFPIIKRAKTRIEMALERRLFMAQPTGVIFNLKNNFGWNDAQQIEQTTTHKVDKTLAQRLTSGSKE